MVDHQTRSPDRSGEQGSSPSYHVPASPYHAPGYHAPAYHAPASPDIIDIDLEEMQGVVLEEQHVLNQVQNLPEEEEGEEGEEEEEEAL